MRWKFWKPKPPPDSIHVSEAATTLGLTAEQVLLAAKAIRRMQDKQVERHVII